MVLYSECERIVYLIELIIPFEDAIEEAFESKKLKYAELVAEAWQQGWQGDTRPVEIGVRGFVAKSTTTLKESFKRALKELCLRLLKTCQFADLQNRP